MTLNGIELHLGLGGDTKTEITYVFQCLHAPAVVKLLQTLRDSCQLCGNVRTRVPQPDRSLHASC